MKFIITNGRLINATTSWEERMGDITQEEFAQQLGGQVVSVPDTYDAEKINISCFSANSSGVYSFSAALYNEHINSKKMDYIRRKRNFECFRIINRGEFWYNGLSQSEKDQLQEWYEAWLALPNRPDLDIDNPQYPVVPAFVSGFLSYEDVIPESALE